MAPSWYSDRSSEWLNRLAQQGSLTAMEVTPNRPSPAFSSASFISMQTNLFFLSSSLTIFLRSHRPHGATLSPRFFRPVREPKRPTPALHRTEMVGSSHQSSLNKLSRRLRQHGSIASSI